MLDGEERDSVGDNPSHNPANSTQQNGCSDSDPPPSLDFPPCPSSESAYATLAEEHRKLSAELLQCKQDLSHSNSRCLELENSLATGMKIVFTISF